jgi:hypothetical protein
VIDPSYESTKDRSSQQHFREKEMDMRSQWKAVLAGLTVLALAGVPAAHAQSGCGDLNNDGSRTIIDAVLLSQCLANGGNCPSVNPGPLCGTGNLADCGDVFGDGNVSFAGLTADLAALVNNLAGLATLFDACEGPGPAVSCPGGTVTLASQTIRSSQTWPANCLVKLGGTVFFETPAGAPTTVLTVEPGTTVQGIKGALDPAALILLPGTRIDAQGTAARPIVFTSDQAPGSRAKGDWAGVVINGRSTVNGPNCLGQGEGLPLSFGGCIDNDSSGIATFLRVEFAGLTFTPNNELNAWTMNGIGSQTQFHFIQAHVGSDDCHEWFGGTSSHHHLVASACGDDGFDFQLGATVALQFGLMLQDGTITDPGRDSRGIEGDNSEFNNNALPRSDVDFCNLTIIGGANQAGANDGSDVGVLLRRGTRGQFANMIVTTFEDAGVELRDVATTQQACVDQNNDGTPEALTGNLVIRNSVFFNNGSGGVEHAKSGDTLVARCTPGDPAFDVNCNCNVPDWYALLVRDHNVVNPQGSNAVDPGLSDQMPPANGLYDGRPKNPLPAAFPCSQLNPAFEDVNYIGAFDPNAPCTATQCGWLSRPWISFATN